MAEASFVWVWAPGDLSRLLQAQIPLEGTAAAASTK